MNTKTLLRLWVLLGTAASFRTGAQSYILDQTFTSPLDEGANINEGFRYVAQTFTAGLSGTLGAVSVDIVNFGVLPLDLQIRGVTGGSPNTTVLGEAVVASGAATLAEPITFAQVIPMTAGTQYAIVASYVGAPPPGAGQDQGDWAGAGGNTDAYPGGGLYASNDGNLWFSESGPNDYNDQFFQTWVEPVPEPATLGLLTLAVLGVPLAVRKRARLTSAPERQAALPPEK